MGKMKELFIDQMNTNKNVPDDIDWKYNQLEPPPTKIDVQTGKKMWEIKSIKDDCVYKIWAESYKQALELLPMIENF